MTETTIELLTLVYALADRIEAKDWATAGLMVEHLLNVLLPLASPIATDIYHDERVQLAEKQSTTKIH
jgi:hypothetical protein